ncbi:MAG: cytochrome c [Phycisphaerales bacterium]|nr:cytochrome c [Phycisphaerales bacterium]
MSLHPIRLLLLSLLATTFTGCDWMPGKPTRPETARGNPAADVEFSSLWATRCAGCHGIDGTWGGARPMNDPIYQSLVSDDYLRTVTAAGVDGTLMPAFAVAHGGELNDQQIDIIVDGIRSTWGKGTPVSGAPPLTGPLGSAAKGKQAFTAYCGHCHGADGTGGTAGSVVDPTYLALVSDQSLRSTIICGRTDLGMPDWRGQHADAPANQPPLTADQVSDIVAWLASQRINYPGQPYPVLEQPGTGRSE